MFDVSLDTARNVTESQVKRLSKSEGVEYSYKIFLFGFATFAGGEVGVQGVRGFWEASSNVTCSRHTYR